MLCADYQYFDNLHDVQNRKCQPKSELNWLAFSAGGYLYPGFIRCVSV